MPPSLSADTPLLSMLVEEGHVSEERNSMSLDPVVRMESRDVVPERRVRGWERSVYKKKVEKEEEEDLEEEDLGVDFVSVGMHVPGSSVGSHSLPKDDGKR